MGRGLINDSYLVTLDNGRHAVLQRINRGAFPQPERIMDNLRTLLAHARTHPQAGLRLPEIVVARDGRDSVVDASGGFWRALSYIENTFAPEPPIALDQAHEIGHVLGAFHALVANLAPERMHATRPGFHDTPQYLARFTAAAARHDNELANSELHFCFEFIHARRAFAHVLEDAAARGELMRRVIHGDPKLDNFLFDRSTRRAVSLIDLDTVQSGLLHYDIGDCLRSCCNGAGESPANTSMASFDVSVCEAILEGYRPWARAFLSPTDRRYLYDAARLIPFELGLRFLTGHLEGDRYFKTAWRGQNLHRAATQFRLTASVEASAEPLQHLIARLFR